MEKKQQYIQKCEIEGQDYQLEVLAGARKSFAAEASNIASGGGGTGGRTVASKGGIQWLQDALVEFLVQGGEQFQDALEQQ